MNLNKKSNESSYSEDLRTDKNKKRSYINLVLATLHKKLLSNTLN